MQAELPVKILFTELLAKTPQNNRIFARASTYIIYTGVSPDCFFNTVRRFNYIANILSASTRLILLFCDISIALSNSSILNIIIAFA